MYLLNDNEPGLVAFQCNYLMKTLSLQDGYSMLMHPLPVIVVMILQPGRSPSSNDSAIPDYLTTKRVYIHVQCNSAFNKPFLALKPLLITKHTLSNNITISLLVQRCVKSSHADHIRGLRWQAWTSLSLAALFCPSSRSTIPYL